MVHAAAKVNGGTIQRWVEFHAGIICILHTHNGGTIVTTFLCIRAIMLIFSYKEFNSGQVGNRFKSSANIFVKPREIKHLKANWPCVGGGRLFLNDPCCGRNWKGSNKLGAWWDKILLFLFESGCTLSPSNIGHENYCGEPAVFNAMYAGDGTHPIHTKNGDQKEGKSLHVCDSRAVQVCVSTVYAPI